MCAKTAGSNAKCIPAADDVNTKYSGVLLKLYFNPAPFVAASSFFANDTERAKGVRPSPLGMFSKTAAKSCFLNIATTKEKICRDYADSTAGYAEIYN